MIHAEKVKDSSVEVMDLRSVLLADYNAIDAGILERGSHCFLRFSRLNVPSPTSFMLITPIPCLRTCLM